MAPSTQPSQREPVEAPSVRPAAVKQQASVEDDFLKGLQDTNTSNDPFGLVLRILYTYAIRNTLVNDCFSSILQLIVYF